MVDPTDIAAEVTATLRSERVRLVAHLVRVTGELELAEDCVQDAAAAALVSWERDGVPHNPAAWLTTTARNRAIDHHRRRVAEARRLVRADDVRRPDEWADPERGTDPVDPLRLLYMCCHPALPMAGRVALTLKTVAGLSTLEIARAFLVSEDTMRRRLSRSRDKIRDAGISFRLPEPHRLRQRTADVMAVVYLTFNEGYSRTVRGHVRDDLVADALMLADLLVELLPDDAEVHGLRALLCLQASRQWSRVGPDGVPITMEEQDRTTWDGELIRQGLDSLALAQRLSGASPGPYRLQAEIAACHATAPSAGATDWIRIVDLYELLARVQPSPIIDLNRAIAIGFRDGPDAAIAQLATIQDVPGRATAHADFLRRAGRPDEALAMFRAALADASTDAEIQTIRRRIAGLLT